MSRTLQRNAFTYSGFASQNVRFPGMGRYTCLVNALAAVGMFLSMVAPVGAGPSSEVVGRTIDNFSLRDFRGKSHSLSDFGDKKAVVVVFLGVECPLAKLYAPRLQALAKEYQDKGVAIIGVDSNVQDTVTEMASYARVHELSIPLLKDPGNVVADAFGAQRTPEAFILDKDRVVKYRGRIDDQYLVGVQRGEPTKRHLALALDAVLAGKPVETPSTEAPGCIIGRAAKQEPTGSITYSKHIAAIFQNRCVECHRPGEIGPFPLTNYDEVVGWGETIREVINAGRMPPWHADPRYGKFRNENRLSDEEKRLVAEWVANGSPKGDPADLPSPRAFTEGWQIDKPDLVLYSGKKPFQVPSEGVVDYQMIEVDPKFTEDKWIRSSEARPGNRAVVHHIIVFLRKPGALSVPFDLELVGGYAPGMPPVRGYPGSALFVPKGSKFVFQMHYTPNGSPQEDLSMLGLCFAKPEDVKVLMKAGMAANFNVKIPPHAADHVMKSQYKFRNDVLLYAMLPHMHWRGKSFKYELAYPDGRRETILDVPNYDFGWQLRYEFSEPLKVPKGSVIYCTAHYDNSENNPANPDPSKEVRFGEQTWEEMMIGWFTTGTPRPAKTEPAKPSAN